MSFKKWQNYSSILHLREEKLPPRRLLSSCNGDTLNETTREADDSALHEYMRIETLICFLFGDEGMLTSLL